MTAATIISILAILLLSVILHEIAHGWVALKFGDTTAKDAGRLTLNPLPHLDPVLSFILPLILFFIGGPIFGGAKPVPVDFFALRPRRLGRICVSLAGVATNLSIAIFFGLILRFTDLQSGILAFLLTWIVWINLVLAVFNLLPIPPLDGSHLWIMWLSIPQQIDVARYAIFGFFFLIMMLPYLPLVGILNLLFYWLTGSYLFQAV